MAPLVELSTRDPERALPTLEGYFPGVTMSNPHGQFALELVAAAAETHSLIRYHLMAPASSSSADMSDTFTFGQVSRGALGLSSSRQEFDTTTPWLFPDERVHAEWDDVTIVALTVSKAVATRMARAQVGADAAELGFLSTTPVDTAHARAWAAFVDYTSDALIDGPSIESPLVRATAFAHLVSLMLTTFPNTIMDGVVGRSRPHSSPASVRRAIAFIDANAHRAITTEDIAREARLSVRALQYAFRRSLDTTPAAYLRRSRLAGAHHELRGADPTTGATVAAIAARWGFAHPGRFAAQYRDAYGRSPRRTLDG